MTARETQSALVIQFAEKFNDFFSNIASNLKAENNGVKIFDPGGYIEFLGSQSENSIYPKENLGLGGSFYQKRV